jgi:HEAT repeat protein
LEDLAIVALAQLGEKQDCNLILNYVGASESNFGMDDIGWLSREAAHLFDVEYLNPLRKMILGPHNLQVLAHRVLSDLCQHLDEPILLEMLTDPVPAVRSYAAEGLVAIGKAKTLLDYETELLNNTDFGSLIGISAALTSAGDWTVIGRLLKSGDFGVRQGVAEGLRWVKDELTYDCLLDLLQSDGIYDIQVHLKAADSLAIVGNESALSNVLEWLLEHPYEGSTNLIASVLVYLDRKLYCPIQWPVKSERDFSILRYSVTRDDYR